MTAQDADPLVVRPQPTHDDAVPNANGVFAEASIRLAQITQAEDDHRRASDLLSRLVGIALDLHLRGLSILVTGDHPDSLRDAVLQFPYLDRSVRLLHRGEALDEDHPAKALASSDAKAQALVCAAMRCSLPVTDADSLKTKVAEMLASNTDNNA